jgi:hypothetical protein
VDVNSVSEEVQRLLRSTLPAKHLRVIILVTSPPDIPAVVVRTRGTARTETAARLKAAVVEALPEIQRLVDQYGESILSEAPTALGALVVETTPAAIKRLASLPNVEAIFAEQEVMPIR